MNFKAYGALAFLVAALMGLWCFIPLNDEYGGLRILGCIVLNGAFLLLGLAGFVFDSRKHLGRAMPSFLLIQPVLQFNALLYQGIVPAIICASSIITVAVVSLLYIGWSPRSLHHRLSSLPEWFGLSSLFKLLGVRGRRRLSSPDAD